MKIKITEIECSAEKLKQSNDLASSFVNLLRSAFNSTVPDDDSDDEE